VQRSAPTDGSWRFVQACRLIEKKGLDDALHAFARFVQTHPQAHFTIAGEGPLLEPLTTLCGQLGIASNVTFAGFLKGRALCDLFHASHIFIHPSRITEDGNQEGIPNAMLEAMATGLPVIATLHGGIPEAVRKDVTGLLVPERDVDGLHASMAQLTSGLWPTMSEEAAADVRDQFESTAQIAKLEAVYDEAVKINAARSTASTPPATR
jgi:colanic acid/amylovoran biosynthesis glycosyltransferase